jgi:hypothetical protein
MKSIFFLWGAFKGFIPYTIWPEPIYGLMPYLNLPTINLRPPSFICNLKNLFIIFVYQFLINQSLINQQNGKCTNRKINL